jgi:hypothetical protein
MANGPRCALLVVALIGGKRLGGAGSQWPYL